MTTQIAQLVSLQALDQRLQQKEQQLEDLHQQIADIRAEKEMRQREADERQQRISELESQQRETDGQLKLEEEKIKEKRVRLNRVRNEREQLALQREIDLMKEANGKIEESILGVMEQLEEQQQHLADIQTRLEELDAQLAEEAVQAEKQIAGLEEEAQTERRQREELVTDLDASLCARYERIFGNRGALAVVEVRDGTCQGCYMRIPPHMCNQIQSSQMQGSGKIFQCPHPYCGRIVYIRVEADGVSGTE